MSEELKCCPFCGHEAVLEHEDVRLYAPDGALLSRAICMWCMVNTDWRATPADAMRAWNERV